MRRRQARNFITLVDEATVHVRNAYQVVVICTLNAHAILSMGYMHLHKQINLICMECMQTAMGALVDSTVSCFLPQVLNHNQHLTCSVMGLIQTASNPSCVM
jgi:hypothetical protein